MRQQKEHDGLQAIDCSVGSPDSKKMFQEDPVSMKEMFLVDKSIVWYGNNSSKDQRAQTTVNGSGVEKKLGNVELESWGTGWSSKNLNDGSQITIRGDRSISFCRPWPSLSMIDPFRFSAWRQLAADKSSSARSNPRSPTREKYLQGWKTRALRAVSIMGVGFHSLVILNIKVYHQVQSSSSLQKCSALYPEGGNVSNAQRSPNPPADGIQVHSRRTVPYRVPSQVQQFLPGVQLGALILQGPIDANAPMVQAFWEPNFQICMA
ncbi:hypothetical protein B0H65DRAFT_535561 [Neurospora tetraspora]|uniref:Uncharacterized protein n=1 Tax=Neurospora tetraspora TaxID=94610 RepID=A0AAE0MW97_9PEZI|nr:hypothetical protein B0H65DRAFT_535561 [Neurospora tetraspora]